MRGRAQVSSKEGLDTKKIVRHTDYRQMQFFDIKRTYNDTYQKFDLGLGVVGPDL